MKKAVAVAAVLAGLAMLVRRFGPKMRAIDWEKRVEAMPGNTRPKWMFRNITDIRENTQRIIDLLDARPATPVVSVADPAAV